MRSSRFFFTSFGPIAASKPRPPLCTYTLGNKAFLHSVPTISESCGARRVAKRDTMIFECWERSCVSPRKDLKPTPMLMRPLRSTAGTDEDPQNSSGRGPFHSRSPVCQLSHSGLQATPILFPLVKSDLIDDAGVGYFLGATFFFPHILPLQQVHAESQHSPLFSIFAGGGCRSAACAGPCLFQQ